MPDVLYCNGRFTTTDEPVVRVEDRGFQFGDSVYEVVGFVDGAPRFARAHWERMRRGLEFLDIPMPWSGWPELGRLLEEILERTEFDEGLLYMQVTRGASERAHFYALDMEPTVIAYSRRYQFPDSEKRRRGLPVVTFEDIRWKRCDIKSVNLLPNVMAKGHARSSGADEAILVEEGLVTEGASSNIFVVSGGRLITHPADFRILRGVTRDRVIEIAAEEGIAVDERSIRKDELFAADEVFLTSTSQGVMPVNLIDDRPVGVGTIGPVTERIQHLFHELERSERSIDPVEEG